MKDKIKFGQDLFAGGGPSHTQVIQRQVEEGYNELPLSQPKKIYHLIFEILKEPMVYLLLGCGVTYFFLGDPHESYMLLTFLILILVITITQEAKAERALEALRDLSSPRAEVLRNGIKHRIPGREVVRDDLLFLNEGDRVAADSLLLTETQVSVNESLLTGESAPAIKTLGSMIFAGTTIVHGQTMALVQSIGKNTEIGKIGHQIQETKMISTRLEQQTRQLVTKLAWVALFLCLLVVVIYSQTRHNWIEGILVGLSLGMAILPNELPAVLTIFFSLGAWRLSKRNILTRKISAIENLGAINVLCVDKTGTLTLNQMEIQKIYSQNQIIDCENYCEQNLPEEFHEALEFGILASKKNPFDPMELAFISAGKKYLKGTEHLHYDWNLEKEYPLSPELLSITHAWKAQEKGGFIIGAKGAPEAIVDLCHMNEKDKEKIMSIADEMARSGLRILGVAKSQVNSLELPKKQHDFTFTFLGLIGIADPIRSGVPDSILECHNAGIRVIMLTGDYPTTACSIAKKIGIQNPDKVISGHEIEHLSETELVHLIKETNIFSRIMPAQKLRLVEALKSRGEVVAMTGDGVNDALALKSADVGIAMGARGTDVARESADIVLLDDDFSSITEAIKTGRNIFANIKNALIYLFAIHIPIAGMSVIPVVTKLPLVLLPAHIAFLHLIIEPISSIAFEIAHPKEDVMKKKPRSNKEKLFNKEIWIPSLLRGFMLLAALIGVYLISLFRNLGEADARTLVFSTLILSNTILIYLSRSRDGHNFTNFMMIGSILMLGLALYLPYARELFHFSFLHQIDIFICICVALGNSFLSEFALKQIATRS